MSNILSYLMQLCSRFRVVKSATFSAWKRCSVRHYLLVCRRACVLFMLLFLFVAYRNVQYALTIWATCRVSYKGHELLTLREHLGWPPVFCGVCVSHLLFSFLCCVFFSLFVFIVCLVHPMLSVSLIAPSFFLIFIWKGTWRGFLCSHCGSHLLTFFHRQIFLWNSVVHIVHNYSKFIFFK